MNKIDRFRDDYRFLSNMYPAVTKFGGRVYTCVESAFQSAKSLDPEVRKGFIGLDGYKAKKLGRRVELRDDWEEVKLGIMYQCVRSKFSENADLRDRLLATGNAELIEGNTWNDTFWGVCNGVGLNNLGKILMRVRSEFKN